MVPYQRQFTEKLCFAIEIRHKENDWTLTRACYTAERTCSPKTVFANHTTTHMWAIVFEYATARSVPCRSSKPDAGIPQIALCDLTY
jgi:hypothetical protein